jgi:GT2 family glycosyltransferase
MLPPDSRSELPGRLKPPHSTPDRLTMVRATTDRKGRFPARTAMALTSTLSSRQASHIDRLLQQGTAAIGAGELRDALRHVDRAWRQAPDSLLVGRLLGRLLNACGYHKAAARHLTALATGRMSPQLEAEIIETLRRAAMLERAGERLHDALQRYAVVPGGPLATAARRIILTAPAGVRGWVGVAPDLDLIGEVAGIRRNGELEVFDGDGELIGSERLAVPADEIAAFRITPRAVRTGTTLRVLANATALTGSGLAYPPDFVLDGRAATENGRITGWASISWLSDPSFDLMVADERGKRLDLPSEVDPVDPARRSFRLDRRKSGLTGNQIVISARLPDGRFAPLPDSPLLMRVPPAARPAPKRRPPRGAKAAAGKNITRSIDIVVPVYLGRAETLECLAALIAAPHDGAEIIAVDDCSPDRELAAALDQLARSGAITLLRNEVNQGFPAAANRGLALHQDRDVVLLNSDAVVHGDWLDRLRRAAYSAADIGSVTPFTNAGSIASYPGGTEQDCDAEEAVRIDALAAAVNRGTTTDLPVGVGFCLYIRRDCLVEVGLLDAELFGWGYGEEVDFCLRAGAHGWRHVLAADVFVRHAGARSFGRRGAALRNRNQRIIDLRYPDFQKRIETFHAADTIAPARRRLDEARLLAASDRYVVISTLGLTGGVERFVRERCDLLRQAGLRPLVLKPLAAESSACVLSSGDAPNDLRYDIPSELASIRNLLARLNIVAVELHHFLDLDPRLVESLIKLDVPFDIYIHDYSWICPRLTLIDGTRRYCGEPAVAVCESCIARNGSRLGGSITVAALRKRSARWISAARQVVVPTHDVGKRLGRYFPDVKPKVIPWETDIAAQAAPPPPRRAGATRVAVIGAIGVHKGYEILLDCARDAADRQLPLQFVVIGYTEDDETLFETGKAFVTGRYDEAEVEDLLRRESPDLVFFPGVAPETWCYALTHAMRSGLPIVGFDLGAVAERLRAIDRGIVLPFTDDPAQLNDHLLRVNSGSFGNVSSQSMMAVPAAVALPARPLVAQIDLRSDLMPPLSAVSASVQILPVSDGLYTFSVRQAAPSRVAALENLLLPAVHVGLGPGIASESIQLVPGPRTNGSWLCERGDMLVAKVSGRATILLTSFQSPTGQTLAIEVDRLDNRAAASDPARQAGAPSFPAAERDAAAPLSSSASQIPSLPLRINMHIRNVGDRSFVGAEWAGRSGTGRWIEAFSILPIEQIPSLDIEYKGLTAIGTETPWIGNGGDCGTRGKAMALVGFAVRMRQTAVPSGFDCEYSGYFASGTVVGPLKNGAPCRSSLKNDPLEGVQVRITPRSVAAAAPGQSSETAIVGPRFSKLREDYGDLSSPPAARRAGRDSAKPTAEKTAIVAPRAGKGGRKPAGAPSAPSSTAAKTANAAITKESEPPAKTARTVVPAVPATAKEGPRLNARAKRK